MMNTTFEEAKKKIYRYCAYQERCHREVQNKLFELGLRSAQVDELIAHLITEGFINEERFAKAFAGGKFRLKKWGRLKIVHELETRGLTATCIRIGLKEIDEQEYRQTLVRLIRKKIRDTAEVNPYRLRDKVAKAVIAKGYEPDLVWKEIKVQFPG
ncbi:MAG: RecX family transcriptional regulator [Flammeovirgaceae bacterium]|nr:MAG: RecX family transcriptional regulator [Flammeovirgaceae bacterium]